MSVPTKIAFISTAPGIEINPVPAQAGKIIRVKAFNVSAAALGGVFRFRSDTGGENISGEIRIAGSTDVVADAGVEDPDIGLFETRPGHGLYFISTLMTASGFVRYSVE